MKGRKGEGRLTRFARWLTRNGDGRLALLVATAVGILAILDVLGSDQLNAAILLVLALLATTLLRDRQRAKRLAAEGAAVRQVDAFDANQERVMACLTTRSWEYRGAIGDVLRKVDPARLRRGERGGRPERAHRDPRPGRRGVVQCLRPAPGPAGDRRRAGRLDRPTHA